MLCRQKRQLHRVNCLAVQNVCFQRIEPHERLPPGIGMAQRIPAVFKFPDVRQIVKTQPPDGEILRDGGIGPVGIDRALRVQRLLIDRVQPCEIRRSAVRQAVILRSLVKLENRQFVQPPLDGEIEPLRKDRALCVRLLPAHQHGIQIQKKRLASAARQAGDRQPHLALCHGDRPDGVIAPQPERGKLAVMPVQIVRKALEGDLLIDAAEQRIVRVCPDILRRVVSDRCLIAAEPRVAHESCLSVVDQLVQDLILRVGAIDGQAGNRIA